MPDVLPKDAGHGFKIEKLDILRALSAAIVVTYHFGFTLIPAGFGVLTFFVISGFLITYLLLRENAKSGTVSLKDFYIRRSLRIFPAFYVYWLIVVGGNLIHRHTQLNWPQAICALFYVTNYYQGLHGYPRSGLRHTWSLSVEEQFYLLWPGLFYLFRKRLDTLARVLLFLIPGLWLYRVGLHLSGVNEAYIYTAFETRVDAILAGCLLGLLVYQESVSPDPYSMRFVREMRRERYLAPTLVALGLSLHFGGGFAYRNMIGFAIDPVLVALLIGQLTRVKWGGWMDSRPISYLGRISYSTYLYQQIVHPQVSRLVPAPYAAYAVLPVVWLVAAVSFELVEKPFLKLKERFRSSAAMEPEGVVVAVGP